MPLVESPTEPPDRWIGALLGKTYRVKRLLGEGGMGAVYEAEHTRLPRSFAVKVLGDASFKHAAGEARFRREAEIACRLKHQHIVEVVDYNVSSSGHPYLVMELLEGEDLAVRLARVGQLPVALAASITHQVASALARAHGEGVVHRDLKPQNIFLCRQADRDDFVKVLDFGISKILGSSSLTGDQAIMGTPWYMAPEQARGMSAAVDHRSDIFALGAILYHMLGGQVPFAGDTALTTLYAVIHEEPPALSALRGGLPARLEAAVMRALAKRPEDRFQDVRELAATVTEAVGLSLDLTGARLITRPPVAPVTGPDLPRPASDTTLAATGETLLSPGPTPRRGLPRAVAVGVVSVLVALGVALAVRQLTRREAVATAPDRRTPAAAAPDLRSLRAPAAAPDRSLPSPDLARPVAAGRDAGVAVRKKRPPVRTSPPIAEPKPSPKAGPGLGEQGPPGKQEPKPQSEPKRPPAKAEPKPKPKDEPPKDWIVKPKI